MYNNFRVYWVNERRREPRSRESFKNRRERSWDRSSQNYDIEENKSKERSHWNRIYTNRKKDWEDPKPKAQMIEEENSNLKQNMKNQSRYRSIDNKKEESREKRENKDKIQQQEKNTHIEDMLGQILERLEKLEKVGDLIGEDIANHS